MVNPRPPQGPSSGRAVGRSSACPSPYLKALRGQGGRLPHRHRFLRDTQVAAPLAFVRCRARARRVITRRTPAKPESIRTGDALAVASIRFVGAISSPSGRHDGYSRGCRNQNSSFRELMAKSRLSPVDETADDWGSRYVSCLLRSQYVASARCRATAPMALGWPLRRAMRS
jgi:hypothetical protein